MPKVDPLAEQQKTLLTVVAEAAARQKIAKKSGIKSGCLVVLAGIVFRHRQGHSTRPKHLYLAATMNEKLTRAYARQLVEAGLVRLQVVYGCRWLSPTLDGVAVATNYARQIKENSNAFAQS